MEYTLRQSKRTRPPYDPDRHLRHGHLVPYIARAGLLSRDYSFDG